MERSTHVAGQGGDDGRNRPERVGPFRILECIDSGGMGVVYLAERHAPIDQRVALKVIRSDRLSNVYRARFAMEQSALARMDHPNIARLLDAGDSDGQSWFAMEYVPGTPLTDYCRDHRLSIEARLHLFTQICDAVQHAHMKGILHRDLKPGNILVREIDGRPVAKIIDFGLAQPIDPLQIRATLHESMRQIVGTVAYMSPEQATRSEGDLDTRTDVYSLGVVLYELLTGELPLDLEAIELRGLGRIGDVLREFEPKKPSTRLSAMGEQLTAAAAERCTSPHRLRAFVRGELDWMTMKALAKDRQHRYATVRDLGRDADRFLRHEPIEAGPPSSWYVAKKWVRRHVVGVGVAVGIVVCVGLAFGLVLLADARVSAERERRELLATAQHLGDLLEQGRHRLWPATARIVPLMDDWLAATADAQRKVDGLWRMEAELAEAQRARRAAGEQGDPVVESQLHILEGSRTTFDDLQKLAKRVVDRRQRALDEYARTIVPYQSTWDSLASGVPGPHYHGLTLDAIPGLVPLGLNRGTNLYEFYLPASAGTVELPSAGERGEYSIGAQTGLIFVLIPGGHFRSPVSRPGAEGLQRELEPFLISRYEMTQAQWARLAAETYRDPADLRRHIAGNDPDGLQRRAGEVGERQPDDAALTWDTTMWVHPVQQVSWEDAEKLLPRWSLDLPTVAQWWWAANGFVEQELHFAWLPEAIGRAVNFADEVRQQALRETGLETTFDWRAVRPGSPSATWDGFLHTCPVDAMMPNPFGLHCVFGNVAELCKDGYHEPWPGPASGPEQLCGDAGSTRRAMSQGGQFTTAWDRDRAIGGQQVPTCNIADNLGLRPIYRALR